MRLNFSAGRIAAGIKKRNGRSLGELARTVLEDSNQYIPRDSDRLLQSGSAEVRSEGRATVGWYTPYAHYQYVGRVMAEGEHSGPVEAKGYTGGELRYSTDKNPYAQKQWFEAAKAAKRGWLQEAKKLFGGGKW